MSNEKKGSLYMLICAIMWSTGGLFIKMVPWYALVISGGRSLIAGFVIFGFMKVKKMPIIVNKRTLLAGAITMTTYFTFVLANKMTTAANAIVLQFTSPIFIMLASVFIFHQKIRRIDVAAVILCLTGISLFFLEDLSGGGMAGNLVAVLMGVGMAAMYMVVSRTEPEERFSCVFFGQVFTFLCAIPFFFLYPPTFTPTAIWAMLGLGVIQIGIPYMFYAVASVHCPAFACCLLSAIEPILNPVLVFLVMGEKPGVLAFVGGIIVITAVTGWCILDERYNKKKELPA